MCCKYASPLKIDKILPYLEQYPNKKAAKILKDGFSFGFKLGYRGPREARDSPNLKSVIQDPKSARQKLQKEIKLGRIAGPFQSRPIQDLIVSPIGLIPKAEKGKFRLIQHLSFPKGESLNDGIDRENCMVQYTKFDVAVTLVASVGKGALMAKADIESAFRLLPIHPEDFNLIGMKIEDDFFVDKALPIGASCSPALFETFSTFLEWVVRKEAMSDRIIYYVDDILCCGEADESNPLSCKRLVECLEKVCAKLDVPLAPEKLVGPTTKLIFLGLEIDSVKQLVTVPLEKLGPIRNKIINALAAEKLTRKELQSLVGSLSFICRAVTPGRPFLRRLIDLQCGIKEPWHKIRLTSGAKSDLRMWLLFLKDFNGCTVFETKW